MTRNPPAYSAHPAPGAKDQGSGCYTGRQIVTERITRTWTLEVEAASLEEALLQFARGRGKRTGWVDEHAESAEATTPVHEVRWWRP